MRCACDFSGYSASPSRPPVGPASRRARPIRLAGCLLVTEALYAHPTLYSSQILASPRILRAARGGRLSTDLRWANADRALERQLSIQVSYVGPDEIGLTVDVYAKAFPDMHRTDP